jgi:amidase
VLIKDLNPVEGVRFTCGAPNLANNIADHSDALVLALEANGGIVYGKSNTPEHGAGSQTFNTVFGTTVTPFDARRTAGGSSGGAAAALASGSSRDSGTSSSTGIR